VLYVEGCPHLGRPAGQGREVRATHSQAGGDQGHSPLRQRGARPAAGHAISPQDLRRIRQEPVEAARRSAPRT